MTFEVFPYHLSASDKFNENKKNNNHSLFSWIKTLSKFSPSVYPPPQITKPLFFWWKRKKVDLFPFRSSKSQLFIMNLEWGFAFTEVPLTSSWLVFPLHSRLKSTCEYYYMNTSIIISFPRPAQALFLWENQNCSLCSTEMKRNNNNNKTIPLNVNENFHEKKHCLILWFYRVFSLALAFEIGVGNFYTYED